MHDMARLIDGSIANEGHIHVLIFREVLISKIIVTKEEKVANLIHVGFLTHVNTCN